MRVAPGDGDDTEMAVVDESREPDTVTETVEWEDPSSLPLDTVRDLFLTLSKALRSYQLYDRNNPVYRRFLGNLRDAFREVWETRSDLQILVEEDRFLWMGEEVYREESRSGSLAFLFYRDGIRDLTFRQGLEGDELEVFLDILQRVRSARTAEDDLVTLLWDLDLEYLTYGAVDLLPEGTLLRSEGTPDPGGLDVGEILAGELGEAAPTPEELAAGPAEEEEDPEGVSTIRLEDFNPALYALDEGERSYVEELFREEMKRDIRMDVLNGLFDRLEDPVAEPERQEEIVLSLRQLLPTFLSQGALSHASRLLGELGRILSRKAKLAPGARDEASRLLDEFSSPESVRELVQAVEEGAIAGDGEELGVLLRHLKPAALGPLLARTEELSKPDARETLRNATRKLAEGEEERLVRFLSHSESVVVAGAVRLMGSLRYRPAVPTLIRLLEEGSSEVQEAVLDAARRLPTTGMAEALERLLWHPERDLRIGAARVLGQVRYTPAASTLKKLLDDKEMREADLTEKIALFEAYADLSGEDGVPFLAKILNHRGFLGRREPPEMRACAALALGRVDGAAAIRAVEEARNDPEPVVRTAVNRILNQPGGQDG